MMAKKPLVGSLGYRSNGTDWLPLVPNIEITCPRARNLLLLLEWENEAPASTGPLPWGPSVLHSAQKCLAPHNQPTGAKWVAALTVAAANEWINHAGA